MLKGFAQGARASLSNDYAVDFVFAAHPERSRGAALPVGASIHDQGDAQCGFCRKSPPDVPGLIVRNAAAICPECLRARVDISSTRGAS
jgi:hypothetical protein